MRLSSGWHTDWGLTSNGLLTYAWTTSPKTELAAGGETATVWQEAWQTAARPGRTRTSPRCRHRTPRAKEERGGNLGQPCRGRRA